MWIPYKKNQAIAECIEWNHVIPAENFGRHLTCWQAGGRKACQSNSK
jgi:deoxyribonuclease I